MFNKILLIMKKLFSILTLVSICIILAGSIQAQTLHNPSVKPTITKEQIIDMGKNHQQHRDVIVLDFEGLGNSQPILDYYNGGMSGGGFGPGPNYGITFSGPTLSIIAEYAGGTGNFQNEPSPSTIMFFLDENSAIMNVAAGFETGFSFYYSNINNSGSVEVYDGLNATGNLIASMILPALGSLPIPGGQYNIWEPVGVAFDGVAKSVKFIGSANYIGFDDITFGSETPGVQPPPQPVPLSNWALYVGIALMLSFVVIRFRRIF